VQLHVDKLIDPYYAPAPNRRGH